VVFLALVRLFSDLSLLGGFLGNLLVIPGWSGGWVFGQSAHDSWLVRLSVASCASFAGGASFVGVLVAGVFSCFRLFLLRGVEGA